MDAQRHTLATATAFAATETANRWMVKRLPWIVSGDSPLVSTKANHCEKRAIIGQHLKSVRAGRYESNGELASH